MMKKLLSMFLAGFMALSLTACGGGGSSLTLTQVCDDDETITATVNVGYGGSTVLDDSTLFGEDEAQLLNEEKNFSMEFYMYFDDTYEDYKTDAEGCEGYQEVKYSGYEGYMYLYDEFEYEICLKLADENDCQVILFAYVAPESQLIDTETTDMEQIFNQKEVQDILNSIKYKGTKKVEVE